MAAKMKDSMHNTRLTTVDISIKYFSFLYVLSHGSGLYIQYKGAGRRGQGEAGGWETKGIGKRGGEKGAEENLSGAGGDKERASGY